MEIISILVKKNETATLVRVYCLATTKRQYIEKFKPGCLLFTKLTLKTVKHAHFDNFQAMVKMLKYIFFLANVLILFSKYIALKLCDIFI
jgi:hypothetical protein